MHLEQDTDKLLKNEMQINKSVAADVCLYALWIIVEMRRRRRRRRVSPAEPSSLPRFLLIYSSFHLREFFLLLSSLASLREFVRLYSFLKLVGTIGIVKSAIQTNWIEKTWIELKLHGIKAKLSKHPAMSLKAHPCTWITGVKHEDMVVWEVMVITMLLNMFFFFFF